MKYWTMKVVRQIGTYISYLVSLCSVIFCVSYTSLNTPTSNFPISSITFPEASSAATRQLAPLEIVRSVVKINNLISGGSGSGVILWSGFDQDRIAHTFIITNKHVVQPNVYMPTLSVEVYDYLRSRTVESIQEFPAITVSECGTSDLALIEVVSNELINNVAPLMSIDTYEKTTLYSQLHIVGCGLGNPPTMANGHLAMIEIDRLIVNGFSVFGCSGGGVFTERGELLAVSSQIGIASVNGIDHPITGVSISVPVNVIRNWLLGSKYKFIIDSKLGSLRDVLPKKYY